MYIHIYIYMLGLTIGSELHEDLKLATISASTPNVNFQIDVRIFPRKKIIRFRHLDNNSNRSRNWCH